ncbi:MULTISPECIES: DUF885 domain-containing protein [unclassified Undibacterium]|uniref:DUF885 domain-containing protein n=1 Tax=unclassified Undibacterium TaxID=2630295 RepID=UPI002AC8E033|nr:MULTISPECIES: DUF885 domain-containing protein [unclassified Undibacterium]MEB0140509.1 DUF885 domain-containing protein [Undibacterium sp. CCC2.1]MEB0173514.1 DUF885 domain-containing protein [Undibacterium sp. CCC1.1]MEB0177500.1 DUF885 domain-containing protein [Undibacterium sp. CCC3.4]MEB0216634.1 DUF885 domain-containing protein [Undibacterium sp. 5I2]WPX42351.1 DUF885 domain-containing protein [Undibacterium sp. CCC3.4]
MAQSRTLQQFFRQFSQGGVLGIALCAAPPLLCHATALAADAAQHSVTNSSARQLQSLAERYFAQQIRYDPLFATYAGERRYDDRLPETLNPGVKAEQVAGLRRLQRELRTVNRARLNASEQISDDLLAYELRNTLRLAPFRDELMPLNQMDSVPVTLAQFASGQSAQALNTVADYEIFLRRLEQLPQWLKQATLNMRQGMRSGIVLPRSLVTAMLPQFQQLLNENVREHAYYAPVLHFPASFSAADQARLSLAYEHAIAQQILPALRDFTAFLQHDYLPASRSSSAWSALPGGTAWYSAWVASQTTTTLNPEQIHAIGLREVARIQSEYVTLGPRLGYHGQPEDLPSWVEQQAGFRPYKSEAEVLDAYRAIDAKVRAKLPALFASMPKAALDIRAEPEISRAAASDHYSPPAPDGSRPGIFWAVITNANEYSTVGMTTLFLHEGQPGHHFHLALQQELDMPQFRKLGGNNAYTEGWALYAETLGHEMGLYQDDPAAYFGHLNDEMLRATRLVVDTGIHAKGWTREESIAYLQKTLGYSEAVARQCIERYMAWPGQALGYKIGALKILELRHKAEQELGKNFDIRAFHSAILSDGALPLSMLESKILAWIAAQKASARAQ